MSEGRMRLKLLLPTGVLLDIEIVRLVAEARDGAFGMLPRHVDFVSALAPGILTYETPDGAERYLAVDEGILVKRGAEVLVSTPSAAADDDLHRLRRTVRERFLELDERQRLARGALARLEAGVVRRFMDLQERG